MSVRRHHAKQLRPNFPQHAVQDWTALFCGDSKRSARDEFVQHRTLYSPTRVVLDRRKRGILVTGKAEQLELGPAAFERRSLFAERRDLHRRRRQLARDLTESLLWQRERAWHLDIRRHFHRDRDVEVRAGEPHTTFRRFDENVREYG